MTTAYRRDLERILAERGWRLLAFPMAAQLPSRYACVPDWERHGYRAAVANVFWFTRLHHIERALGLAPETKAA
jgi:hypothetical protein